ncbi:ferritin-like domain-containing protein [Gottfriedia acidiceleris]|uniref:Ferritin-like domain-containing protein n=1 Tax=Gottfriedia acidiceleris TaxID=371036 RepID=A0ABY4JHP6_9BACI|nr:ferritin-like domain-containing protein [Gottfriedia acidiceleris]UPM53353.1 ferritin-like domain-containing protein [Gottfriedia acidiceleris]
MYYYQDYGDLFRNQKLINDIEKAINGEYSAISCYTKLADMTKNKNERKIILEIKEDEIKHYNQFVSIYTSLTGRHPQAKVSENCPDTYIEGLEFALKDEQETVDFYLSISDETSNQFIKNAFNRAAKDEQNHAVWFLYFFTKNKLG